MVHVLLLCKSPIKLAGQYHLNQFADSRKDSTPSKTLMIILCRGIFDIDNR